MNIETSTSKFGPFTLTSTEVNGTKITTVEFDGEKLAGSVESDGFIIKSVIMNGQMISSVTLANSGDPDGFAAYNGFDNSNGFGVGDPDGFGERDLGAFGSFGFGGPSGPNIGDPDFLESIGILGGDKFSEIFGNKPPENSRNDLIALELFIIPLPYEK